MTKIDFFTKCFGKQSFIHLAANIWIMLCVTVAAGKSGHHSSAPSEPVCDLMPIALSADSLNNAVPGDIINDILSKGGPGHVGWLSWNGKQAEQELAKALKLPGTSHLYRNPNNPCDRNLTLGDWVAGKSGRCNSRGVRTNLKKLISKEIIVPVWDEAKTRRCNLQYQVVAFAKVKVLAFDLRGKNPWICAEFLGFECGDCNSHNQAPIVEAGEDQQITLGSTVLLSGIVSDDGLPSGEITTEWTVLNEPVAGAAGILEPMATTSFVQFAESGEYFFQLTADDGELNSYDTVAVVVGSSNSPPIAFNTSVSLEEDGIHIFQLSASDPDGDFLIYEIQQEPGFGTASHVSGQVTYVSVQDYNGEDSLSFVVYDSQFMSNTGTVSLTIQAMNDQPLSEHLSITNHEDTLFPVVLSGVDPDNDALEYQIISEPSYGSLIGPPTNLFYKGDLDFFGQDSFVYNVSDGTLESLNSTVQIVLLPVNDVPTASDLSVIGHEDGSVSVFLSGSDQDGDALSFIITQYPTNGTLSGTAPELMYYPNENIHGADSFVFAVSDGLSTSATATVYIIIDEVNDVPLAVNQSLVISEDGSLPVVLNGNDVDADSLSYMLVTVPTNGTLSGLAPNLVYTPSPNVNGGDLFNFVVLDGVATSAVATVEIAIEAVNDMPAATGQSLVMLEDASLSVTLSGTDVDGEELSYIVILQPINGTLTGTAPDLVYTPVDNANAAEQFTFAVTDGTVTSSVATVSITIHPVNDVPVASNQSITTPEDTNLNILLEGTDVDGDALSFSIVSQPSNGTLSGTVPDLLYIPAENTYGLDQFTFSVSDGMATSAVATVSISVASVNDAPVVNAGPDQTVGLSPVTGSPLPEPIIPELALQWLKEIGTPGISGIPNGSSFVGVTRNSLSSDGVNLYAAGIFNYINGVEVNGLGRWDGSAWHAMADDNIGMIRYPTQASVGPVCASRDQTHVYVAGGFLNPAASWDSIRWQEWMPRDIFAFGGLYIQDIRESSNGIYIGGQFDYQPTPDNTVSKNIIRWTGSEWEHLGVGVPDTVFAIAVDDSSGNDVVYAGGHFTVQTSAGIANSIVVWDGNDWSPVGAGVTFRGGKGFVNAIEIAPDGSLYVGGKFDAVGGMSINGIAHVSKDVSTGEWIWEPVGQTSGEVNALAFFEGKLYVGTSGLVVDSGRFMDIVAVWDGASWSQMNPGGGNLQVSGGVIRSLCATEKSLFVGGQFTLIDGEPVGGIAEWGRPPLPEILPPSPVVLSNTPVDGVEHSLTATIRHPDNRAITVTVTMADGFEYTTSLEEGTTAASVPVSFTRHYVPGSHLVSIAADDGIAPPVTYFTRVTVLEGAQIVLNGVITDDGQPSGMVDAQWLVVDGPGTVFFTDATSAVTTASFSNTGIYKLKLFGSDTELSDEDEVTVTVLRQSGENLQPLVHAGLDQEIYTGEPLSLNGQVIDDGLVNDQPAVEWSVVSDGNAGVFSPATSAATTVTFTNAGVYTVRLTADDGELQGSDELIITVTDDPNLAPVVHAGMDRTVVMTNDASLADAHIFDDGLPYGVLDAQWTTVSGPSAALIKTIDDVKYAVFGTPGTYVLRLTVSDGRLSSSDDRTFTVVAPALAPELEFSGLEDGMLITSPTNIIGTISSSLLESYELQYRMVDSVNVQAWTTFATGASSVSNGVLGVFDPTLLLNGMYEVRLVLLDILGESLETEPVAVIVDGNMKVGNFTLSFSDLNLPLSGIPIEVIRTYDSRDPRTGDFGKGWSLSLGDIRLQKNRDLGERWQEAITEYSGLGLAYYEVVPYRDRIISVTFPDNTVYRFKARFTPSGQHAVPILDGDVLFDALPGTHASLEPVEKPFLKLFGQIPEPDGAQSGFVDLLDYDTGENYAPKRFRLTMPDGTAFIIHEDTGLEKVIDPFGNEVEYTDAGIFHSNGGSVSFNRDVEGRITSIVDPDGQALLYRYDAEGHLIEFENREGEVMEFYYENTAFPDYLTRIVDPTGADAIRTEYDANGRMIRQIDAYGNPIDMGHDIPNRIESVTNRLGHVTVHEYDENGNVVKTTDALGGITTYTYDDLDNQLSKTDPLGRTTSWTYDADDNQTSEIDPLGNTTTTTYDARRNPLSMTDANGNTTWFEYGDKGQLTNMVDAVGNSTMTLGYDAWGNLLSQTDALGNITTYAYDTSGNMLTMTDPLGAVTEYTYDGRGNRLSETKSYTASTGTVTVVWNYIYDAENRLVETVDPFGNSSFVEYDANGKETARIDELGRRTEQVYNDRGELIEIRYPDGTMMSSTYDLEGRKLSDTDQATNTTQYVYDALGRMTHTIHPDGAVEETVFDAAGQAIQTIDALGNGAWMEYDDAGRLIKTTDALGNETVYQHDSNGNMLLFIDANSNVTAYVYDDMNRRTKMVYPDATVQTTLYDALSRRAASIDQAGITNWYGYTEAGRLGSVTNAMDGVTRYVYDELGRQTAQIDALGRVTGYEYDVLGRRTKRTLPEGQVETVAYNVIGLPVMKTDFNGKTTTFAYDVMNRLTAKVPDASFGAPSITYGYDARGLRTSMADAHGTTTYTYDERGQRIQKASPNGTLDYTYNDQGLLISTVSGNANGVDLAYSYDVLNRLRTVSNPNTGLTMYGYDAVGNLSSIVHPNGLNYVHQYDALNRLTDLTANALTTPIRSYTYTLAATGHRLGVTESTGRTVSYQYDNLHRLLQEDVVAGGGDPGPSGTVDYTLDAVGNRLSRTSTLSGVSSQTFSYSGNDLLDSDSYDANGNTIGGSSSVSTNGGLRLLPSGAITSPTTVTDVYDFENRLVKRTTALGDVIEITYDGDGNRVKKTVNGLATWYLVDDNNHTGYAQVVEELGSDPGTGDLLVHTTYDYGLDLISQSKIEFLTPINLTLKTHYYGYDGHGNVRFLTDGTGAITDTYDYDAFGLLIGQQVYNPETTTLESVSPINASLITINHYRYCGEQFDNDLGMYFLRARYLEPDRGRFWTMDNYEGRGHDPATLHKYLYCHADPVNGIDPSGMFSLSELSASSVISSMVGKMSMLRNFYAMSAITRRVGMLWTSQAYLSGLTLRYGFWMKMALDDVAQSQRGRSLAVYQGANLAISKTDEMMMAILKGNIRALPVKTFKSAALGPFGAIYTAINMKEGLGEVAHNTTDIISLVSKLSIGSAIAMQYGDVKKSVRFGFTFAVGQFRVEQIIWACGDILAAKQDNNMPLYNREKQELISYLDRFLDVK